MPSLRLRLIPRLDPLVAHNLRCDIIAGACGGLYLTLPANFAGVIGRNLGAQPFDLGIYWAFAFAGMVLASFSGFWLPRGALLSYAVIVGVVGRSLVIPAALISEPLPFLIVMALSWSTLDVVAPVVSDTTRRIYPLAQRGQLVAWVRMAAVLSALIGATTFGLILDQLGRIVLLPLGGAIGVVGWLFYRQIRIPSGEAEPQVRFTFRDLYLVYREDRRMVRWLAGHFVWGSGISFVWPILPLLLVDRFHASYTQVGILATIASIAGLGSYLVWGRLADVAMPVRLYAVALAATALVPLVYLLSPSVSWLALAAICQGIAFAGLEVVGFSSFSRLPPEGMLPRYYVALTSVLGLRGIIAGLAGSALFSVPWFGPTPLLLAASLFMLIGAFIIRPMRLQR